MIYIIWCIHNLTSPILSLISHIYYIMRIPNIATISIVTTVMSTLCPPHWMFGSHNLDNYIHVSALFMKAIPMIAFYRVESI